MFHQSLFRQKFNKLRSEVKKTFCFFTIYLDGQTKAIKKLTNVLN
ncbi:hypothetical protein SAMN06269250_2503 [Spirosoma fluviale]|uniref:Uncharacterized protein n=1 Tax=Spirosoma fluviale TaxID=1597977 RepID=A0A286FXY6_9BACT|nr:hypothetical protein SAMN06269250_2503 [Spirosoma fluviale]